MILGLRLAFVLALYAVVAAVLVALRRDLRRSAEVEADGLPVPAQPVWSGAGRSAPAAGVEWEARLTLVEAAPADGRPGRVVPLDGEVTIGRRPPAEIVLLDDAVSGQHARLTHRQGEWVVEDLGSTNGTYVNGRRLTGPVTLRPGDLVVTGKAAWRYEEEGRAA